MCESVEDPKFSLGLTFEGLLVWWHTFLTISKPVLGKTSPPSTVSCLFRYQMRNDVHTLKSLIMCVFRTSLLRLFNICSTMEVMLLTAFFCVHDICKKVGFMKNSTWVGTDQIRNDTNGGNIFVLMSERRNRLRFEN